MNFKTTPHPHHTHPKNKGYGGEGGWGGLAVAGCDGSDIWRGVVVLAVADFQERRGEVSSSESFGV